MKNEDTVLGELCRSEWSKRIEKIQEEGENSYPARQWGGRSGWRDDYRWDTLAALHLGVKNGGCKWWLQVVVLVTGSVVVSSTAQK